MKTSEQFSSDSAIEPVGQRERGASLELMKTTFKMFKLFKPFNPPPPSSPASRGRKEMGAGTIGTFGTTGTNAIPKPVQGRDQDPIAADNLRFFSSRREWPGQPSLASVRDP